MNFIPLSSLKSKQVKMPSKAKKAIEEYADYISSQKGAEFDSSDIITKVLLDDGFEKEVKKVQEEKIDKVSLKLPDAAWKNFEELSKKGKLSQEEMVELISNKLLKDRKFLGWRNKAESKAQTSASSPTKKNTPSEPTVKKNTTIK